MRENFDLPRDAAGNIRLDPAQIGRRVRVPRRDVVRLGALLLGDEGLASLHGDHDGVTVLVAPRDREAELDAFLAEMREELELELLGPIA